MAAAAVAERSGLWACSPRAADKNLLTAVGAVRWVVGAWFPWARSGRVRAGGHGPARGSWSEKGNSGEFGGVST